MTGWLIHVRALCELKRVTMLI